MEREARDRLPSLLGALIESEVGQVLDPEAGECDFRVEAGGRLWLAEVKSFSGPGNINAAADRFAHHAAGSEPGVVAVVVVPHMTPAGAKVAQERGINWIDLSGNARIRDRDLYVRVEGLPNQFPRRGRPASAFAPKSARIARVLLTDPARWWRQMDLARETGLDGGHLSRVVRRLDEDQLLEHRDAEFRPLEPGMLLDAWADDYRFDRHDVVGAHLTGSGSELATELHRRLAAAGVDHGFTGLPAAWAMTNHARYRLVSVFVHGDPRSAIDKAGLRRGERGANVQVIGPNDDGVFAGGSEVDGLPCVSPPQVYLDLLNLPERAQEAADRLRGDGLLWDHDGR